MTPKNVLITHVYSSDNKGDAALTSVLIKDIKRKFPDAELTILRLEAVKPGSVFEEVPEEPSFMYYALNKYQNPLAKLFYTIYMVTATLVWASWRHFVGGDSYLPNHLRDVARFYERADLIVPVGGGYIRSRKGLVNRLNVPLLLHPLLLGFLLKKPTVLYSQSVGPFQNALEERMVAFVLQKVTRILIREDTSIKLLAAIGVTNNVVRAIDSGFLLKSSQKINLRQKFAIPAKKLLLGVTVRSWLRGEAQAKYEKAVAQTLDNMIENANTHVIFIPQVTATKGDDDRVVSRRVCSLMNSAACTVVEDTPDHHEIKSMYNDLDILLGTRFHSVIFSLISYVPVVAIEYEHKTSGIMHDLDLEKWVIKIEEVTTAKLTELLQNLIKERTAYRRTLEKSIEQYQQKALEAAEIMAEAYIEVTAQNQKATSQTDVSET